MKKILVLLLCVCMAVAGLCACGGKEEETTTTETPMDTEILGTWTESKYNSGYQFKADGTGVDVYWNDTFTFTAADGELIITYDDENYKPSTYSYDISGGTLTMTSKDTGDKYTYQAATSSERTTTVEEETTEE